MTIKVTPKYYVAAAHVYGGGPNSLAAVERSILQFQGRIAASAVAALTDSSGAPASTGTVGTAGAFTLAALGSTDCATKAALETDLGNVTDGLKEIIAQSNLLHAHVPALDAVLVDNLAGTAADGTIGAITDTGVGAGAALAGAVGANLFIAGVESRVSQLIVHVNKLAVACGVASLIDATGVKTVYSPTFAALSPADTGVTESGADATPANAVIKAADVTVKLTALAKGIKEMATTLNACRSATGGTMGAVAA
jgi:hypothetical protein